MPKSLTDSVENIIDFLPKGQTFTVQSLYGKEIWELIRKNKWEGSLGKHVSKLKNVNLISGPIYDKSGKEIKGTEYERI